MKAKCDFCREDAVVVMTVLIDTIDSNPDGDHDHSMHPDRKEMVRLCMKHNERAQTDVRAMWEQYHKRGMP